MRLWLTVVNQSPTTTLINLIERSSMTSKEALAIAKMKNIQQKETAMIKAINIYGKRIIVDQIHSYLMDEENDEVILFCNDQAYTFPYSKKLMNVLDSLFDVFTPDLTKGREVYDG